MVGQVDEDVVRGVVGAVPRQLDPLAADVQGVAVLEGDVRRRTGRVVVAEQQPPGLGVADMHGSSLPAEDHSSSPTEELSPTELRVLRYLPTNLSRPEIAGELSVSVNTVNTHIRNIYAKLQARDRSSAVRRARQLRLLGAGRAR